MPESKLAESLQSLLGPEADRVAAGATLQRIAAVEPASLAEVVVRLADAASLLPISDRAILGGLLRALQVIAARADAAQLQKIDPQAIRSIDASLPAETPNRFLLLYLLSAARSRQSLTLLADLLSERPPTAWMEVGQVLSPLMQHDDWQPSDLFPAVLRALHHPSVAAPVLDLANFLHRKHRIDPHPASESREQLASLLGGVAGRLGQFEEDPRTFGNTVEQVQTVLGEAVALAVSLCDALGLIRWEGAVPKLRQAMELTHRRVQAEAAGALARLGDEAGRERLIALAAEPSTRLRVIAYAEELGLGDAIPEEHTTAQARAEAEMALWLSQPQQMAVPPTAVEVIDQRTQYWPGFDSPVDCFLVRFEYNLGDRAYSNVGITGPMVHAVGADLADLPVDDIYAVYAGWQAEHEEIFTVSAAHWNAAQKRLARPLLDHLDRLGFESVEPALLGLFLDEHALIARGIRDETECLVVTDGLETTDHPTQGRNRPLTPDDMWHLFLGRKMLRTFNR